MSLRLPSHQSADPAMAQKSVKERKEEVLELLKRDNLTKVILVGKPGTGKTWMAKELSDPAVSNDLFDVVIWVFLNRKYEGMALYENIAWQLSLLPATQEWDIDDQEKELQDGHEKRKHEREVEKEDDAKGRLEKEKERHDKLEQEVFLLAKKRCLLILDGEGDKESEEEVMSRLKFLLHNNQRNSSKVLMTRRERNSNQIIEGREEFFEVGPLSKEDSMSLLEERAKIVFSEKLREAIFKKSGGLPAAIIAITEALNHIGGCVSGVWTPESSFEEVTRSKNLTELLCHAYDDKLPNSNVISNCFWHSIQLFRRHGDIHYNELITYWIMEGYFDPIDHLEEAYEKGHRVLMKFIDSGFLIKQEDNVITMEEGAKLVMTDCRRLGFGGSASLGLPDVRTDGEGLGRVIQTDGMIKTLCQPRKWDEVFTLLVDGSRLCREVPDTFFQHIRGLRILALFNPRFKSLPVSVFEKDKLVVLVLRGCHLLEKIYHIQKLKLLTVLEISGASSLKRIPDNIFEQMLQLQSLNLSSIQVTSLPSSVFKLIQLRWLILRGCSHLETLPSLGKLINLEVLVLSGSTSFKRFQDRTFAALQKLQILDLSYTSIERLPFFHNLCSFSMLILRGCESISILPCLKPLSGLQILDVSGAIKLKQLPDKSLENKSELKFLDLSKTSIDQLPSNIGNVSELYLSGCSQLSKIPHSETLKELEILDLADASSLAEIEDKFFDQLSFLGRLLISKAKVTTLPSLSNLSNIHQLFIKDCTELVELPHLNALEKLEILDLSGCRKLTVKQDESFEKMCRLQKLDLSETNVEHLPSLSNPSNLRHLLLRNCTKLKKLPPLESSSKLEELNLCGASSLSEINAEFLKHMSHLRILNLSGIPLEKLPSLDHLNKLSQLVLSGCSKVKDVPQLEALTTLEVLDLSGTGVGSLPSPFTLTNLRELSLTDCQSLKKLPSLKSVGELEVLKLWGIAIEEFPYEVTELTHLKCLALPDLKGMADVDWTRVMYLPEELNWDQCGISKLAENSADNEEFYQFLEKNPILQDAYFKRFHIYFHGDEQNFKDIYSLVRHCPYSEKQGMFLEIHGSYNIPDHLTSVLRHAENISLIDNMAISHLSESGARTMEVMKRCCLERCNNMESILGGEEKDVRLGTSLETLWLSNLPKLRSICSGNMKPEGFKNLKDLYLDCCPMLRYVFSSSQLPPNLETLQIKFCDKLQALYEDETPAERSQNKLKKLYLLELPELKRIGIALSSLEILEIRVCPELKSIGCVLPSLRRIQNNPDITECPQLEDLEECLNSF